MRAHPHATVIGGGIAGSEAAWQLASRGYPVTIVEMRPHPRAPAHRTGYLAELVCSNSFKSDDASTAAGLLKHELTSMGSLIMAAARRHAIPAGAALAVDRDRFAADVTDALSSHPLIEVRREEATAVPADDAVLIATGPLTSEPFASAVSTLLGADVLSFYDAAAPVVDAATLDRSHLFAASRYGKGEGADYLNCPLDEEQYRTLRAALVDAKRVELREFERGDLFQACQPVEEIARTGEDALRFGPLKPVGLEEPETGERPFAVVQLRAENAAGTAYNLVGFQTNLTFSEQRRVFSQIPALRDVEFLRFGVMHRNTFVDAPSVLEPTLRTRSDPALSLAGQITGTEGYLEAAGTGLLAALNITAGFAGLPPFVLPETTALGSLVAYATSPETTRYQPMHVNFGLVPPLDPPVRGKRPRYEAYAERARGDLQRYLDSRADLLVTEGMVSSPDA